MWHRILERGGLGRWDKGKEQKRGRRRKKSQHVHSIIYGELKMIVHKWKEDEP